MRAGVLVRTSRVSSSSRPRKGPARGLRRRGRLDRRSPRPARPRVPSVPISSRWNAVKAVRSAGGGGWGPLRIGGERIHLAWYGSNHSPDDIYIHLPDHDTLMLVDIVNAG